MAPNFLKSRMSVVFQIAVSMDDTTVADGTPVILNVLKVRNIIWETQGTCTSRVGKTTAAQRTPALVIRSGTKVWEDATLNHCKSELPHDH